MFYNVNEEQGRFLAPNILNTKHNWYDLPKKTSPKKERKEKIILQTTAFFTDTDM